MEISELRESYEIYNTFFIILISGSAQDKDHNQNGQEIEDLQNSQNDISKTALQNSRGYETQESQKGLCNASDESISRSSSRFHPKIPSRGS